MKYVLYKNYSHGGKIEGGLLVVENRQHESATYDDDGKLVYLKNLVGVQQHKGDAILWNRRETIIYTTNDFELYAAQAFKYDVRI